MAEEHCPHCGRVVPVLADGSFALHGRGDGSLCPGTNCRVEHEEPVDLGPLGTGLLQVTVDPDDDVPDAPAGAEGTMRVRWDPGD